MDFMDNAEAIQKFHTSPIIKSTKHSTTFIFFFVCERVCVSLFLLKVVTQYRKFHHFLLPMTAPPSTIHSLICTHCLFHCWIFMFKFLYLWFSHLKQINRQS